MGSLRFLLILVLTVALDLSSPLPQTGAADLIEEFEEVVHVHRGRRPFRRLRDTVPATVARETAPTQVYRPRPAAAPHSTAPSVTIRKLPPPAAESSSAPEDH